jgi:aminoglycoside phosphotransferase (APT) family kinase protein
MATTLRSIERQLVALFPQLAVAPLRHHATGFGSIVVETSDQVMFRIARTAGTAEGHAREERLLPALRQSLPVAIPAPEFRAEPGAGGFAHGVIGYRRIPGTPLDPESLPRLELHQVASQVAAFLVALHGFPAQVAAELGVPESDRDRRGLEAIRRAVHPPLKRTLSRREYLRIQGWWDGLLHDAEFGRFTPVLTHGDLWYDHVLLDEEFAHVVAIVDWESAALGDPASDLATQLHLGEAFAEATINAYAALGVRVDEAFRHRMRRHWELREVDGVRQAVALNDRDELEDGVRKLRAGPILAPPRGDV